ncbi:MAG: DUF3179 domain-containing protein [Acidobacteria bacterium]|nr:MAG: DUF3179 domain-containing protein [Acidobacteriota bacterium]
MRLLFLIAVGFATVGVLPAQQPLPYRPIDHPHFVAAAQASFLAPSNLLIGVSEDGVSRAYPAAIVAQHGIVEDQMPDGPITVTW